MYAIRSYYGLTEILTMSHELALIAALIILLISEIFSDEKSKYKFIPLAFALILGAGVVGLIFGKTGIIFGGMYQNDALRMAMNRITSYNVCYTKLLRIGIVANSKPR